MLFLFDLFVSYLNIVWIILNMLFCVCRTVHYLMPVISHSNTVEIKTIFNVYSLSVAGLWFETWVLVSRCLETKKVFKVLVLNAWVLVLVLIFRLRVLKHWDLVLVLGLVHSKGVPADAINMVADSTVYQLLPCACRLPWETEKVEKPDETQPHPFFCNLHSTWIIVEWKQSISISQ